MTILLTGFEPFGGEAINPSWEMIRELDGQSIAGHEVRVAKLSCVFGIALQEVGSLLAIYRPALTLCFGQAGGRAEISLERIAINVDDARIPDNAGRQPIDEPVVANGPAAYFSTLPIKAMVAALRHADIPASVSQTAGTFVCNHVFYGLSHLIATDYPGARSGFVHVPFLPYQAARHPHMPCMSLETMKQAVPILIHTALATAHDIKMVGGETS